VVVVENDDLLRDRCMRYMKAISREMGRGGAEGFETTRVRY